MQAEKTPLDLPESLQLLSQGSGQEQLVVIQRYRKFSQQLCFMSYSGVQTVDTPVIAGFRK